VSARFALVIATALAASACSGGQDAASNEAADDVALPPDSEASGATPMRERVAVLGLLNKRNGIVRDLTLRPGQSIRVKDVIVRLRACETTAPWETEKLTGAFVQVDVERPDKMWARVFSGWLYKESPSLNVVEHPVYDVWPKSCTMRWPGAPDAPPAPSAPSRVSRAPNSGGSSAAGSTPPNSAQPPAEDAPSAEPEPSAAPSNAT
jgi:hypothetical protein